MNPEVLSELRKLSGKIAVELDFAEADKDMGLLPVNCLLGQMEELLPSSDVSEMFTSSVTFARSCVDGIFKSTGTFSAASLEEMRQWAAWWQSALDSLAGGMTPAPMVATAPQPDLVKPKAPDLPAPAADEAEETALVLNIEQDGELLGEFLNESQEHLQNIEQGVLTLEENPSNAETLNSIFRAFHTFKGGSGFLNLTAIQTLAHELESLLDKARQNELEITPAVINVILEGGDTLKQFTSEMGAQMSGSKPRGPIIVPTSRLLAKVRAVIGSDAPQPTAKPAPLTIVPVNAPEPEAISLPRPAPLPVPSAPSPDSNPAKSGAGGSVTAVKVDTVKLDTLVDMVGEMVIAQSLVVQNPDLTSMQSEQLSRDLAQLGRITREVQRTVMSLRMVPIRATFQKMNRLVRDITAKVGKKVELVTEGEDTELDRTIVEEISDPLIHMIRNSIDHGIEKPDLRQQKGKPEHGTVLLRAFHQGGNIVIEIKDDGNGLDRDRILAKAVEKGLVKAGEQLGEKEVFNLILGAGFSTAEKVTDLSGRGVGMDVVRRNVEKLRGKIEIQSTPGQGSTFSIYLPLTLAIIDGLLVGVGEHRYIIPTLLVRESFRPTADMISTIHGRGETINLRGRLRPLLRLYSHLGVAPTTTDPMQSIVIVVEVGNEARCIMVDKLLGKQEVVIKTLGETFSKNRALAGAAILGDGRVGLILDPQALVHLQSPALEAAA